MEKVLVIGGSNIDYKGTPKNDLRSHDSNPGSVKISFGGVGRNIVENLARLKADVTFITAIGNDTLGASLKKELEDLGVNVVTPKTKKGSASYLAIHNETGDMEVAIIDDSVNKELTEKFLESQSELIDSFEYIVLEGNLPTKALEFIFKKFPFKTYLCEGVSTTKVTKFKPYLSQIHLMKCNTYEAMALAYQKMSRNPNMENLMTDLLMTEGRQFVVTDGAQDIFYIINSKINRYPVKKIENYVNATGAGDACFSGIIYMTLNHKSLRKSIEFGCKLASLSLMTEKAVNEKVSKLVK